MKTHFDCFPCFLKQAKRVGQLLKLTDKKIWQLLKETACQLALMDVNLPPPQNAVAVYDKISMIIEVLDPFYNLKQKSINQALDLYPILEEQVARSNNKLEAAIRYAAAGNVVDYGISSEFDLLKEIDAVVNKRFFKWDFEVFQRELEKANWVLVLGDNCGESVLDKLLIKELKKDVYYAVRGGPIINDVTYNDAKASGIDKICKIISTGCKAPGIIFEWCSKEFLELFEDAPLIISKGQGNFETLSDTKKNIFFLFKIKCQVVASFLNCPLGSMYFGKI